MRATASHRDALCSRTRCCYSSATPLPPHWSAYIHPEGTTYFHRSDGLRVVTNSNIYDVRTRDNICAWAEEVECQARLKGINIGDHIELFLQLSDKDCNYYLVDTDSRRVFWLEEHETWELGAVSRSHLGTYHNISAHCKEFEC